MEVIDIAIEQLQEAPWNPNVMDQAMRNRLHHSIKRFGLIVPLVVRKIGETCYETAGGGQRLAVAREMGFSTVPCVVVDLDDVHARLLAQALNRIQGEDDLGLRAVLLRDVLEKLPQEEVLALLPETPASLQAFASLGQETLAQHLQAWKQAQEARLRHLAFQLIPSQLEVVEQALAKIMARAGEEKRESPNLRGTALYLLCKDYLEREGHP